MTGIFEVARKVFKRNSTIVYDAENVSKALVSAHHYLHHVLLAGSYCDAGKLRAHTVADPGHPSHTDGLPL